MQYAKATNSPPEKATGFLAGIFAFIYLSCEVVLKLVAGPAFAAATGNSLSSPGVVALFSGYSVVCVVACIGVMFIPDVPIPIGNSRMPWCVIIIIVVVALRCTDARVRLA